jgi:beta-glucosidase
LIQIAQPLDFLGLNIYFGHEASFDEGLNPIWLDREPGAPHSDSGWPIQPSLLFWAPKYFFERYNTPIVISENGFSNLDWVSRDGRVHDSQRIDFLQRHLIHLQKAIEDGTPIKGYFYWTFLDNFEWTEGYEKRFGLVHVDFQTQERILKDSAFWYRDLIRSDGASLNDYPFKGNYGTYRPNESI